MHRLANLKNAYKTVKEKNQFKHSHRKKSHIKKQEADDRNIVVFIPGRS